MEREITSENFETEVLKSEVPVLVDFYADWCRPCKAMGPVVEQLASDYKGKLIVGKFNVDEGNEIAVSLKVLSIPTLLLFKHGEIILREVGEQNKKALEKAIDKVL